MHTKYIVEAGIALSEAKKVLIMIHGRGADARDILGLAQYFGLNDFALLAPQATNHTWYPYSFLAPVAENEPWLSSAIDVLQQLVADVRAAGIADKNIYFLGFSQGACLTLEFIARNAVRYGGAVAFTGGLIGEVIERSNYAGDFGGTPVFIGTSDPDPHVPVHRVNDSAALLQQLNASVTKKIYPNMGHTINQDEISEAQRILS